MSSMLKKKSAFKPKVPARRNAPAPTAENHERSRSSELHRVPASDSETPVRVEEPLLAQSPQLLSQTSAPDTRGNLNKDTAADQGPSEQQVQDPASTASLPEQSDEGISREDGALVTPSATTQTSEVDSEAASAPTPSTICRKSATLPLVTGSPSQRDPTQTTTVNPASSAAAPGASTQVLPSGDQATSKESATESAQTVSRGREAVQAATPPAEDVDPTQVQQTIEAAGEPESPVAPTPKRGRKRKADAAATTVTPTQKTKRTKSLSNGQAGANGQASTKTKRPRTKRTTRRAAEADEGENPGEVVINDEERPARKTKRGRQRSVTPEDAENVQVNITQVKMADLAKDLRIGKKFSRHDELANRERARRQTYKLMARAKKGDMAAAAAAATIEAAQSSAALSSANEPNTRINGAKGPVDASALAKPRAGGQQSNMAAPQFQIVDGQIVLDTRSLLVDRHARAAQQAGELEEEVEDEFSRRVTSATYLRRSLKPNQWSDEETTLFYTALASFGTDFDTISRMFPGKERRHVKLKFNREERECPNRINAALIGEKTQPMMDIDEYGALTGLRYEDTDAIYAEQREAEKEFEARQRKWEEEEAEEKRRKREALYGGGAGDENALGMSGAKPKRKRVSNKAKSLAQAKAMAGPEICVGDL